MFTRARRLVDLCVRFYTAIANLASASIEYLNIAVDDLHPQEPFQSSNRTGWYALQMTFPLLMRHFFAQLHSPMDYAAKIENLTG